MPQLGVLTVGGNVGGVCHWDMHEELAGPAVVDHSWKEDLEGSGWGGQGAGSVLGP